MPPLPFQASKTQNPVSRPSPAPLDGASLQLCLSPLQMLMGAPVCGHVERATSMAKSPMDPSSSRRVAHTMSRRQQDLPLQGDRFQVWHHACMLVLQA